MNKIIDLNLAQIISFLKSSTTIFVTWLGIIITVWFAYYTFKFKLSSSLVKKQLYNAYLPMFKNLEPFLYKDIKKIGFSQFKELMVELQEHCDKNYELVEPQIISYNKRIIRFMENPNFKERELNEMYKRLCSKIDFEFENTRKKLGLPTRNVFYKLNHEQYETKQELFYYIIVANRMKFTIIIILLYFYFRFNN